MIYSHKQKIKQRLCVEKEGVKVGKKLQDIHQTIYGDPLWFGIGGEKGQFIRIMTFYKFL